MAVQVATTAPSSSADEQISTLQAQLSQILVQGKTFSNQALLEAGVPAVALAVVINGKIAFTLEKGIKYNAPVSSEHLAIDSDTQFQAASISKPVSAMVCLRLVDQGLLDLDTDVNAYLKSWKVPSSFSGKGKGLPPITLRQILCHGAGLSVHGFGGYADDGLPVPSVDDVLSGSGRANNEPIQRVFLPFTASIYSGGGFVVLLKVIEDVTGKPFAEAAQELVLEPLGMSCSTFNLRPGENFACGHRGSAPIAEGQHYHLFPEATAAGLWTTPLDLAKFYIGVRAAVLRAYDISSSQGEEKPFLSTSAARQLCTKQFAKSGYSVYGLGFELDTQAEEKKDESTSSATEIEKESVPNVIINHSGSNTGYNCDSRIDLKTGNGVMIMTNSDYSTGIPLMRLLRPVILESPLFKPVTEKKEGETAVTDGEDEAEEKLVASWNQALGGIYAHEDAAEEMIAEQADQATANKQNKKRSRHVETRVSVRAGLVSSEELGFEEEQEEGNKRKQQKRAVLLVTYLVGEQICDQDNYLYAVPSKRGNNPSASIPSFQLIGLRSVFHFAVPEEKKPEEEKKNDTTTTATVQESESEKQLEQGNNATAETEPKQEEGDKKAEEKKDEKVKLTIKEGFESSDFVRISPLAV